MGDGHNPQQSRCASGHAAEARERAGVLLTAVESKRSSPIRRAVFEHAKIVHVMEGRVRVDTSSGSHELLPGSALVLGAGRWCSMQPMPFTRVWTLYIHEAFLRAQFGWILTDPSRVRPGVHPDSWDGSAIVLRPGIEVFQLIEPVWRRISVVDYTDRTELGTSRMLALFTRTIEFSLPSLLVRGGENDGREGADAAFPVRGTLVQSPLTQQVRGAIELLRGSMAEPWTVFRLSQKVSISPSHLTRLFNEQVGVAPMRFLAEVRLTEFTRLLEETELSISSAAKKVGWRDARVASRWFSRRFGVNPSQYRRHPHPTAVDGTPSPARSEFQEIRRMAR